jgi:hypothetical protein
VVQRVNSDLRLNPHIHSIALDGVFVADSSPVFHPLAHLDDSDLADLLQVIRVRLLGFLERKGIMVLRPLLGVVESRHELTLLGDDFAERDPALAQLAAAAVAGLHHRPVVGDRDGLLAACSHHRRRRRRSRP